MTSLEYTNLTARERKTLSKLHIESIEKLVGDYHAIFKHCDPDRNFSIHQDGKTYSIKVRAIWSAVKPYVKE